MLIGQSKQVCLLREVPADHEAHSQNAAGTAAGMSVVRTLKHSLGGSRPWKPNHDRIHTQVIGESGPEMDGDVSVTTQSSRALETHPLHTQRAEGRDSGARQSSRPRAAREGAC